MSLNIIIVPIDGLGISLPYTLNYNKLNNNKPYISDDICGKLDNELNNYDGVFEFCENYTGIFENFAKLSFTGQFNHDSCTIVKFWLYDRLFNLPFRDKKVNNDISEIILKLKENFNVPENVKICDLFNFPHLKEDFDKMKSVYDYATNYSTVETYLNDKSFICNQNLSNYINANYEIYINTKNSCNSDNIKNKKYCKVFDYIKGAHINENYPLSCKVKGLETIIDTEGHIVISMEKESSAISEQKDSIPFSNIIMAVIFPLLGIFFFSFILYKFTTFKSWLKSHLLKKKIIQNYEDEEYMQEHLSESYRTDGHHIYYHPS
ncbi:PIR Superfamily Protein [Plasmodium malariae]|uniref:PIR Superfamily Protein n=1 Tax=Plasmodium malariae TaxID=5858 RepID=A0A1A8WQS3_PLAMA|nr:PIR Superfamily Protein [Plasmodium malariae]